MKEVIAVFDFDGTLTNSDSLPWFLVHSVGLPSFILLALKSLPILLKYAAGFSDNESSKEQLITCFFGGMSKSDFKKRAEEFSSTLLPRMLRSDAMARLRWHREQGHRCVLVSAAIEDYLIPWARAAGFESVLATRLEVDSGGNVTGKFSGRNCYGAEKVRRLKEQIEGLRKHSTYAYGDSRGDKELLEIADHPFFKSFTYEKTYFD